MKWWRALVDRFRTTGAGDAAGADTISAAKAQLESRVLAMPGVVSVGVGRADDGAEVIVVGVDGSRPDVEPDIPNTVGGFPVEVRRTGPLRPL